MQPGESRVPNWTQRSHIAPLPQEVIERIAAGEVIERPASVARELIENALDAGATNIRVEIRDGGLRLVRVADNGAGIAADELELACRQHTTSKVHRLSALEQIPTVGFRGEALASLAAVAELELISSATEDGLASVVTLGPGRETERGLISRPRGTTVTVRALFAEMPARRALLRGPAGEARQLAAGVRGYALAHPAIHFTLVSDGAVVLYTNGNDVAQAVAAVYGTDLARTLLSFGPVTVEAAALTGVVSARLFDAPDRQHIVVGVNGRPIANKSLLAAAEAGYRPVLRKGRHPVLVVAISVPPDA